MYIEYTFFLLSYRMILILHSTTEKKSLSAFYNNRFITVFLNITN